MNINIYLPDELGQRAKDANLPFSQLLREVVQDALTRRDAMSSTLQEPQTYELEVEDRDGSVFTGRITGKEIAFDDRSDVTVYLTDDERVIVYDANKLRYEVLGQQPTMSLAEELGAWLHAGAYTAACEALGIKAVIDL